MRKRVKGQIAADQPRTELGWLNLEQLSQVEITSEDPSHPIEEALVSREGQGWRAASPGNQTIRLDFDEPQKIRHIHLEFEENERARTQEFVLRCSTDGGGTWQEIVRQQYNFAPPGTTAEVEDYRIGLDRVTVLELQIRPDVGGSDAVASLKGLLVA